ncbi:MAG: universal stress protein [Actinomycetes bacterium]|nr:universal stress protein [Actinomycetes bacterium]
MVVGRRGHGAAFGHHLGSTGRALIREASCPVMIAPQR